MLYTMGRQGVGEAAGYGIALGEGERAVFIVNVHVVLTPRGCD